MWAARRKITLCSLHFSVFSVIRFRMPNSAPLNNSLTTSHYPLTTKNSLAP